MRRSRSVFGNRILVTVTAVFLCIIAVVAIFGEQQSVTIVDGPPTRYVQHLGDSGDVHVFRIVNQVVLVDKTTHEKVAIVDTGVSDKNELLAKLNGDRIVFVKTDFEKRDVEWLKVYNIGSRKMSDRLDIKPFSSILGRATAQGGPSLKVNGDIALLFAWGDIDIVSLTDLAVLDRISPGNRSNGVFLARGGVFEVDGRHLRSLWLPDEREFEPVELPKELICVSVSDFGTDDRVFIEYAEGRGPYARYGSCCVTFSGDILFERIGLMFPDLVEDEKYYFIVEHWEGDTPAEGVHFKAMYFDDEIDKFEPVHTFQVSGHDFLKNYVGVSYCTPNLFVWDELNPDVRRLISVQNGEENSWNVDSFVEKPEEIELPFAIKQCDEYFIGEVEWMTDIPEIARYIVKSSRNVVEVDLYLTDE